MAEGFKLRICFRKSGRLRFLSHLETGRAWERAARRAGLPYAVSQGFTPRMRIAFGPALPVGTAGEREYLDIVLKRFIPVAEVTEVLRASVVPELGLVTCGYVPPAEGSLASRLTIAVYEVEIEGGSPQQEIERSLNALVGTGRLSVEHKGKHKVFELAKALPKKPEVRSQEGRTIVRMWVRMGEQGSLRPEVFIAAAVGPDRVVSVTRTDLLIEDQQSWRRPL
ncbi:MAG: TIGR03936 family radical SAM-associated protein [Coriobacteriia bacterium]|nr:TIGR03936 family radical SAM-associated protein [Coriobacteriia bacterium]